MWFVQKNAHAMTLGVVHEKNKHAMTLAMVHEKNTHEIHWVWFMKITDMQ